MTLKHEPFCSHQQSWGSSCQECSYNHQLRTATEKKRELVLQRRTTRFCDAYRKNSNERQTEMEGVAI